MKNLPELLVKNPVFASMAQPDLKQVEQTASSRSYQKGEKIILYGDVWPYLFLVGAGLIDVMKESSEGRSLRVASICAGELFWGLAFFHEDVPMPVTLNVCEDSLLADSHPQRTGLLGTQPLDGRADATCQQPGRRPGFSSGGVQAGAAATRSFHTGRRLIHLTAFDSG
jgi:hypothetical protein